MTEFSAHQNRRSYGCSMGCGNPYDVIVITVSDSTTQFLCFPCWVKLAADVLHAITDPDSPQSVVALQEAMSLDDDTVPGPRGKSRGRNAPTSYDDPDIFDAFDSVITFDELPDEFK